MTEKAPRAPKPEQEKRHANIYAALSAFQGELKPLERSGKVTFKTRNGQDVEFSYTPLDKIMATIYPLLAKHGLSVRHELITREDGKPAIEAILTHETFAIMKKLTHETDVINGGGVSRDYAEAYINQLRSGPIKIAMGDDMMDTGAAITYARRYSLTMVLGLASEEDKDAELLEQSAKNAISFAYSRAEKGIQDAKSAVDLEKASKILREDLKMLESGKAPALGLSKEQYQSLLQLSEKRSAELAV